MSSGGKALVISGVRTGMGRSLALLGAARGYRVFGCASSPAEALEGDAELGALLEAGSLRYSQCDVAEREQVERFHQDFQAANSAGPLQRLDVIANAGIARWGDPGEPEVYAEIERMRRVNVDGTRHLAEAFQPELKSAAQANFVGMGSIVSAEGRAIAGNTHYMATKLEAQYYATGSLRHDPRFEGVRSFAAAPGVVPTPMIVDELLIPMIFRNLMLEAQADEALSSGLSSLLAAGSTLSELTPAQRLRGVLQEALAQDEKLSAKLDKVLPDDPDLERRGLTSFMRAARQAGAVRERVLQVLYALDLAVTPELVAERILEQCEAEKLPRGGVLKIYSKGGQDPIVLLMKGL